MSRQKTPLTRIAAKEAAKTLMAANPSLTYNRALGEVARKNGYANAQDMIRAYLPSSIHATTSLPEKTRFKAYHASTANLEEILDRATRERLPIIVDRRPGTGFTSTLESLCRKTNRELLMIRSSVISAADFLGAIPFPACDPDTGEIVIRKAKARPEWLEKIETAPAGVLVFDDFDLAEPELADLYKDMLEHRAILDVKLPDGWTIMLAASSDDLLRQSPPETINAVRRPHR